MKFQALTFQISFRASSLLQALEEYPVASDYLRNYHRALATLQRCTQENAQFAELTKVIKTTDTHEANTLEGKQCSAFIF